MKQALHSKAGKLICLLAMAYAIFVKKEDSRHKAYTKIQTLLMIGEVYAIFLNDFGAKKNFRLTLHIKMEYTTL